MKPLGREMAFVALLGTSLTGCSTLHIPFRQSPPPPLQTGQGSLAAQAEKEHQPPPPLPPAVGQTAPPALPPVKQRKARRGKRAKREEKSKLAATAQEPSNHAPGAARATPATSAIGPLTAGDSATESKTKQETEGLIAQTEQGLAAIKRALSKDEQTTAGQIRTFLDQAKQALANGDSDGANTLATKAKLLLDELTKP